MESGAYRDARTGLRELIGEADRAIEERRARATPALTKALPEALRARIDELSADDTPKEDSVGELKRVVERKGALIDALDEALAIAPKLEAELRHVAAVAPTPPRQDDMWGPIGTEGAMVPLLAAATAACRALDPNAQVNPSGARIQARLEVAGAPLLWMVDLSGGINVNTGLTQRLKFLLARHRLELQLSEKLPRLAIRREGVGEAMKKLLHVSRDLARGDSEFDRAFVVEGDEAFVRPLLTEELEASLLERAKHGQLALSLDRGLAIVHWGTFTGTHIVAETLATSVAVLVALRDSAAHLELLRS